MPSLRALIAAALLAAFTLPAFTRPAFTLRAEVSAPTLWYEAPLRIGRTAWPTVHRYTLIEVACGREVDVSGKGDLRTFVAEQGGQYVLRRKK